MSDKVVISKALHDEHIRSFSELNAVMRDQWGWAMDELGSQEWENYTILLVRDDRTVEEDECK